LLFAIEAGDLLDLVKKAGWGLVLLCVKKNNKKDSHMTVMAVLLIISL